MKHQNKSFVQLLLHECNGISCDAEEFKNVCNENDIDNDFYVNSKTVQQLYAFLSLDENKRPLCLRDIPKFYFDVFTADTMLKCGFAKKIKLQNDIDSTINIYLDEIVKKHFSLKSFAQH